MMDQFYGLGKRHKTTNDFHIILGPIDLIRDRTILNLKIVFKMCFNLNTFQAW